MAPSFSVAIWFCIFALIAIQNTESRKVTRKIVEERRIRALRPRFVKRESQAPLLHAPAEKIDDEYIVKLKDDLTDEELAQFEEKFQALSEEHGIHIDFQINVTKLMKGFVARIPGDAVDILRWLDEVDYIEEDEVAHGGVAWGLDRINQADLPLDLLYTSAPFFIGTGVNVFVVDTGILFNHEVFGGRAHPFYDGFSDGYDGSDCTGHGTHCAGTIGGNTVGVAPGVTLYSCRVFNCDNNGPTSGIIAAMDQVAGSNMKPAVVSMSLLAGASTSMNLAVRRLTEAGYIVPVCSGNYNDDACLLSPASALEAITVGATDSSDGFAGYSSYGSCVSILAPGTNVYSSTIGSDSSYTTMSGCSMATPHVSGVAALLLEEDPTLTQDGMFHILMNAAQSGKIDMSVNVPESHRSLTPNQLLQLPTSAWTSLKYFDEAKTFDDAQATCEEIGMTLVKDTNTETHTTIVEMLQNNERGLTNIWLNGKKDSFGAWLTTEGVAMNSYQPWAPGEPNGNGDCLQLWAGSGHEWDDISCASTRPFICQVEYPMTVFNVAKTFSDAQATCEANSMVLVKDISKGKHAAIINLLHRNGMAQTSIWVNGKTLATGAWVTTEGVPFGSYQPWAPGEPNGNGDCLQLWAGSGHNWDDISCASMKPFICQSEPPMKLFTDAKPFKSAYTTCAANGMSLVKDTSAEKHAAIVGILDRSGMGSANIWINGKSNSVDGWVTTDGVPLGSYQPWQPGEPNGTGDCIQLWAGAGHTWDDAACSAEKAFICQPVR